MRDSFASQLDDMETRVEGHLHDAVIVLEGLRDDLLTPSELAATRLGRTGRSMRRALRQLETDLITLTACQAPVASDLLRILALMRVAQHLTLVANQFRLVAEQLAELDPDLQRGDPNVLRLREMVGLAATALQRAGRAFAARAADAGAGGPGSFEAADDAIDTLNREVFATAHARESVTARRELAIRHVLIARSLERIGDNAVKIAEQGAELGRAEPLPPVAAPRIAG